MPKELPLESALLRIQEKPIGPYINGFTDLMRKQGYARSTIYQYIIFISQLNQWLQSRKFCIEKLNEDIICKFIKQQLKKRKRLKGNITNLKMLLQYLRQIDVIPIPEESDDSEISRIVLDYEQYLIKERGLISKSSYRRYTILVRKFLTERFGEDEHVHFSEIKPQDITDFILRQAATLSSRTVQLVGSILRSFFRFLYLQGDTATNLSMAIPRITERKLVGIPNFISPKDVRKILQCCDQTSPSGIRDYAILLLFARLGLRSGEVVSMTLDDIDWEAGEITIWGKGARRNKLPLPCDIGKAIAAYLLIRPCCTSRHLFIKMFAPYRGFKNTGTTYSLVETAFNRAGIDAPQKGPHILRHSLATEMLHKGATMSEIADILRHESLETTRIYAKVDITSLHSLALPWPGGAK